MCINTAGRESEKLPVTGKKNIFDMLNQIYTDFWKKNNKKYYKITNVKKNTRELYG